MPTTLEAVKVALSVAEVGVGVISQLLSHMVRRFFQIDGDAAHGIAGPCLSNYLKMARRHCRRNHRSAHASCNTPR